MKGKLVVVSDSMFWEDGEIDEKFLRTKNILKTLSLLLAARAGVQVPSTLLMFTMEIDVLNRFFNQWGPPLMIRMDYQLYPKRKTLGGIPIYKLEKARKVSEFLFNENCYPLFHPHLDRFADKYSAGILLNTNDYEAHIEIVGEGFDASDLRLGNSTPHESMKLNILDNSINNRSIISDSAYAREKEARKKRVLRYKRYVEYANNTGILLPTLDDLDQTPDENENDVINITKRYIPVPMSEIRTLIKIAHIIRFEVIDSLPSSKMFVASLSFLPSHGWVLWDIYGGWYNRGSQS